MIKAILAVDQYGGMGYQGTLPWPHNPHDLQNFSELTTNHVVIMGRNTWDDPKMPKPLPNRKVYVATNRAITHANAICGDIREHAKSLEQQYPDKIIWIAGGPELILKCQDVLDAIHVTHFKDAYRTDVKIDMRVLLRGFRQRFASVSPDFDFVHIRYEPLFTRNTN